MQPQPRRRPRVARETRLLLATAFVAVVALSILGRLRTPERTVAPPAVAPILAPLLPRQGFADLAEQLKELTDTANPRFVSVALATGSESAQAATSRISALRIRSDVAVALLPAGGQVAAASAASLLAHDPATGFAVVRVAEGAVSAASNVILDADNGDAGYLMTSARAGDTTVLLPVLVPGTARVNAPLWSGEVVAPVASAPLPVGSFVFTSNGDWVGLVAQAGSASVIVPAPLVVQRADHLVAIAASPRAQLGIRLQPLTPTLARAAKASTGVMVQHVDTKGPANGELRTGDVLESLDGRPLPTWEHWQRALADLRTTAPVRLAVSRGGEKSDVQITPTTEASSVARTPPPPAPLGWRVESVRGVGSRITALPAGSRAERAGLRVGDVITMIATTSAPTPAQLRRAIDAAPHDQPLLIAVLRGDEPSVVALEP